MSHIFCCANISKHKYKLYARSSRTNSEIIGIIRPISTHRHSFVHQGRLAIFFQSQPDFSIHRRFCLKCYTIAPRSWHINHLIKLRRPSIGKCSWDIGNKALFSSVNGICTPVFCPSSLHPHSIPEKCAKGFRRHATCRIGCKRSDVAQTVRGYPPRPRRFWPARALR